MIDKVIKTGIIVLTILLLILGISLETVKAANLSKEQMVSSNDATNMENLEDSKESFSDTGQSDFFTEELADGVAGYINFSYKMQIITAALLSLIAGALIALAVFKHFSF